MNIIDESWDALAETLRQEIEGYGRLFGMLNEQRDNLLKNNIDGLLGTTEDMSRHTQFLDGLRNRRESLVSDLWKGSGGETETVTVKNLLQYSPGQSSPMFEELLSEVNRLVAQSRQKLQHNQMLLHRSQDIQHRFLMMLNPEAAASTTYARDGQSRASKSLGRYGRYHSHA